MTLRSGKQVNVLLPPDVYARLQAFAEESSLPNVTSAVRVLIETSLDPARGNAAWLRAARSAALYELSNEVKLALHAALAKFGRPDGSDDGGS